MKKHIYINYKNNNLMLTQPEKLDDIKLIKVLEKSLKSKYNIIPLPNKITKLVNKTTKKDILIYCDFARNSGINLNNSKRMHVVPNYLKDVSKIKPISIYYFDDTPLYIYFSDHQVLINKSNKNNKSVWIDFSAISIAIKSKKNLKYLAKNVVLKRDYFIYLSFDIESLINFNDTNFEEISDLDFSNELSNINEFMRLNNENNKNISHHEHQIDKSYSNIELKLFLYEKNKLRSTRLENKELYIIAEKLFEELIRLNPISICDKINILSIKEYLWVNSNKESYLPYDFVINKNIFIDVKCTEENEPTFYMSNNEYEFMKKCPENDNLYYIANLVNVTQENKRKWFFFGKDEIEKMNCIEKIERKFFK